MTSRPVQTQLAVVSVAVLLVALVVTVPSSTAVSESSGTEADDPQALDLLTRSATADDRVSYTGTRYVTAWTSLRSSKAAASAVVRVQHEAGGSTAFWVHDKRDAVSLSAAGSPWLAAAGGPVAVLATAYHVRTRDAEYVAGRLTDVVEAVRDDGSVAAILWLDRTTALPLRRETFDIDGRMLSASAFVDVRITGAVTCCSVTESTGASFLSQSEVDRLRADGFLCPESLYGEFVLYDARQVDDTVQFAYSDGVMSLSIFQQPGTLDHQKMDGKTTQEINGGTVYVSAGPPARFTWESGGLVTTVVTDAPVEVVHTLMQKAGPDGWEKPETQNDGFFERLTRGAHKVGSWLNPFD